MSNKKPANKKTKKRRTRSDGVQYLYDRYIGTDPKRRASVAEQEANLDVAQKIHDLRGGYAPRCFSAQEPAAIGAKVPSKVALVTQGINSHTLAYFKISKSLSYKHLRNQKSHHYSHLSYAYKCHPHLSPSRFLTSFMSD